MYQISVELHFDADHFLRGYQGQLEALQVHRFVVIIKIRTAGLDDIGLAYDFTVLKQHLADILSRFDHICLNDMPPFDRLNPSSENIANTIYNDLQPKLAGSPASLSSVEVWESPQSGAAYSPD